MMYYAESVPQEIALESLDKMIAFACKFLDLEVEELNITFEPMDATAAYVDTDCEEEVVEMSINNQLHKVAGELERTIFHELVHVKQVISGKLNTVSPARWLGKTYEGTSYYDLPWEKEAYALEEVMYQEWNRRAT